MIEEDAARSRAGYFTLDVIRTHEATRHVAIPGWGDDERWNGWEAPCFEREAADLLATTLATIGLDLRYEPSADAYIHLPEDCDEAAGGVDPEDIESYGGQDVEMPDGRMLRLYPVGTRVWCWEPAETRCVRSPTDPAPAAGPEETLTSDPIRRMCATAIRMVVCRIRYLALVPHSVRTPPAPI